MPLSNSGLSLFLAGDAAITQPWSGMEEASFLRVIDEIRAADVAIANLESVIHEYKGYAQAEAGGTWLTSPPRVADDLVWAGFDLMAHANNHTFDYGSSGVLETHEHARRVGLTLAGSGRDLQAVRSPAYVHCAKGSVALVSMASTFTSFGRASRSRPDLRGRPGLNPLTVISGTEIRITRGAAKLLQRLMRAMGRNGYRFSQAKFKIWGLPIRVTDGFGVDRGKRIVPQDLDGNLMAVREAASKADIVVVSVHTHWHKYSWLRNFAHQSLDAGADLFFVQGAHYMSGIEIYKGKPIFYGLGDFAFQADQVERLPSEFYDDLGLGDQVGPVEGQRFFANDESTSFPKGRAPWEGVGAMLKFKDRRLIELRLLPLDLGFDMPAPERGLPRAASGATARRIIGLMAEQCRPYGTEVLFSEEVDLGLVRLAGADS